VRRPLLGFALLLGALGAVTQQGSTASNDLPAETTVVHRATTVTGATALSIDYTLTGDAITSVTARLQKKDLLGTTVTAGFGSDAPVGCVAGPVTVVDLLLNLGEADYTCTGFLESGDRPRPLTIRAS
jgi:hypothetical protein